MGLPTPIVGARMVVTIMDAPALGSFERRLIGVVADGARLRPSRENIRAVALLHAALDELGAGHAPKQDEESDKANR